MDKGSDISDEWLAIVLAGFVVIVACFHVGVLAAIYISDSPSTPTLADSAAALVRLPGHFVEPGKAWANPIQVRTVWFWLSELAVITTVTAVAFAAMRQWSSASRLGVGVRPNAGIARARDLRRLRVRRPTSGRLTVGRVSRGLVATDPQSSVAVIGPTGCGKTAGFAIPAILEWSGPVIATSVKTDLIDATLTRRLRNGTVSVFDPTNCTGLQSAHWSPLHTCGSWLGAQRMAAWMCESAQPRLDTLSDGDYWYAQARKALAPYLFAAAIGNVAIADVATWIDNQEEESVSRFLRDASSVDAEIERRRRTPEFQERLAKIERAVADDAIDSMRQWFDAGGANYRHFAEQPASAWPTVFQAQLEERIKRDAIAIALEDAETTLATSDHHREHMAPLASLRSLWAKDQRLRDSVFATVENVVAPYAMLKTKPDSTSVIDFPSWLSGDNTIYVVASSHEQARMRPVLTTFVQQAIREAFDTAVKNHGSLQLPCLTLLDEAGNIAPLRDLPAYASTARSHNISLVTVWQDMAQIRALYRDRAQTVLNNHRAKLFGSGIADEQTLEYVSRLIGDVPHKERNMSRDMQGDRRSLSEHTSFRRAAPIDELRRMGRDKALLVYGSEVPALVKLRPWFKDRQLIRKSSD